MENTPKHSDTQQYAESVEQQQPKTLSPRHRKLMRILLAGRTLQEAADELGFSLGRASVVVNSALFKEEMAKMEEQIAKGVIEIESEKEYIDGGVRVKLEEEAMRSLNVLIGLRDGASSERVKQVSALEILDRAGYKASEKVESKVQLDASTGLLNALNTAIKEMRRDTQPGADKNS